jgi:hypothetical protein
MSVNDAIDYVKTHEFMFNPFKKYNHIIKNYVWNEGDKVVRVFCDLDDGVVKGVAYFNVSLWDIEREILLEKLRA